MTNPGFTQHKDVAIFTTARLLQVHLELDFLLGEIFQGIPVFLDLSAAMQARTVLYMEHDLDRDIAKHIKGHSKRLVLIHLGDERGNKSYAAYEFADSIFRNYYLTEIFRDTRWSNKTHWLPNGYRNGLASRPGQERKRASERKQFARFIGWLDNTESINNERFDFIKIANASPLLNSIPTAGFNQGFSSHLYQHVMEDTIFAPCPAGNAAETIRLFDAMECGSIPITCKHEFLSSIGAMCGAPVIFVNNWSELPEELERLNTSLSTASRDQLQEDVKNYWRAIKDHVRAKVNLALSK
jgi:hypothetical protein